MFGASKSRKSEIYFCNYQNAPTETAGEEKKRGDGANLGLSWLPYSWELQSHQWLRRKPGMKVTKQAAPCLVKFWSARWLSAPSELDYLGSNGDQDKYVRLPKVH